MCCLTLCIQPNKQAALAEDSCQCRGSQSTHSKAEGQTVRKREGDLSNLRGKMRFHISDKCLTSLGDSPVTNTLSQYSWVKRSW